jgi:hypothetical protein
MLASIRRRKVAAVRLPVSVGPSCERSPGLVELMNSPAA